MSRSDAHTTDSGASLARPNAWQSILMGVGSAALAALSWAAASRLAFGGAQAGVYLLLALLQAGMALALEGGLRILPLGHKNRFRLAFLLSALWGVVAARPGSPAAFLSAGVAAWGGAFLGGLAATALGEPLWENNSPPGEALKEDVAQRHRQTIQSLPPIPPAKRAFDVLLASSGLLLSLPVWLLSTFCIWIEDPGPLLFVKNSVGRGGVNFHQFKFRTMVREAEKPTGPVLARERDERVLASGRLLRKTALDELPQLLNILIGEMSFVGPRPQRTVLVQGYLERMPEYAERHRVLPGLAGLAQVAGDYYLTPRQKLRFDHLYIRYTSLGFDLKLILLACMITFYYRWRPDWNGRLPRRWLHPKR